MFVDKKRRCIMRSAAVYLLALCLAFSGCAGGEPKEKETVRDEDAAGTKQEGTAADEAGQGEDAGEETGGEDTAAKEDGQGEDSQETSEREQEALAAGPLDLADVPAYSGAPYVAVNNNVPAFSAEELAAVASFETYSGLDALGRCGEACASVGTDLMPTEKRGSISSVKPSGWHSVEYDTVEGKSLYNRCHLIGYQLTAENANEKNLITGTRYLNTEGMLPFENMVADYVKETNNHVLYRVTPFFEGENLVASGVQMEGMSVEDKGEEIFFNVYCYNVQPGIAIDYATGDSRADGKDSRAGSGTAGENTEGQSDDAYILNTSTKKFHYPTCSSVRQMIEANTQEYNGDREEVVSMGYDPCGRCKP